VFLAKKVFNKRLEKLIIVLSIIIAFYFWDFGEKYNLNIDFRYITLLPLLFFFKKEFLKKDLISIYIIFSYLIFQYIYNFTIYQKIFSLVDLKYFIAFVLTSILTVLYKNEIISYKKEIINFLPLISIFFILSSNPETIKEIDLQWQCQIIQNNSKLFNLFFLENSHYAMVAIPAFLLNLYYLTNKFSYLNFIFVIIFFLSFILFSSTTLIIGLVASMILILFFNFKKLNLKFIGSIICILFICIIFFKNTYGCSRKVTDLLSHINLRASIYIDANKDLIIDKKIILSLAKIYTKFYSISFINSINFSDMDINDKKKVLLKINVSSQVLQNSIEISLESIVEKTLGVGLNRFEDVFKEKIAHQSNHYSDEIMKINQNDGGSNFSKLLTELGLLFIIFLVYLLFFIFSKKISIEDQLFLLPIIITQIFRGAGYFNGGFLISVILIILLVNEKRT
jgi:hypothetical protein